MRRALPGRYGKAAFTLVEILVATSIIAVLVVGMFSIVNQANTLWRFNKGRSEQFRNARLAFDVLTRQIGQATLNPYWDYVDSTGAPRTSANESTFIPARYIRQSELRFICGKADEVFGSEDDGSHPSHAVFFQAPLGFSSATQFSGLENMLNTRGYFVEYGEDPTPRPSFVTTASPQRFRLVEMMEPAESLSIYKYTSGVDSAGKAKNASYYTNPPLTNGSGFSQPASAGAFTGREWFTDTKAANSTLTSAGRPVHVLAENVIALIILPKLSPQETTASSPILAPNYSYDSTMTNTNPQINSWSQLPPVLQVTMVAIDEESAARMEASAAAQLLQKVNSLFSNSANFEKDLLAPPVGSSTSLESYLISQKIAYRIFTSSISIKAAKWSREQAN